MKKVFVSGCYDMLHSGHVAFFEEASKLGELYVGIGSDKTIFSLKGRKTICSEQERLYMVQALKYVKKAWINTGNGVLDFEDDIEKIMPDILYVNEDGHSIEKEKLCVQLGITYIVGNRTPHSGLPVRSTTALRKECHIPYRIDLAGGWLDQPFVSKYFYGPVITISIEPDYEFNDRSGMSTSTRKKAISLWQTKIPEGNKEELARILFSYENPPGVEYISGSQDALGIILPGANFLWYEGEYWPNKIKKCLKNDVLEWLEQRLSLIALKPREENLAIFENKNITEENAQKLSIASQKLWKALCEKDVSNFGKAMIESFEAQMKMFPNATTIEVEETIKNLPTEVKGYKMSGAGGGGYLVVFSEKSIDKALKIRICR